MIRAADVLDIFPGARIVTGGSEIPEVDRQAILEEAARWVWKDERWQRANKEKSQSASCPYCDKPHVPEWRRGGKIVRVTEADGTKSWSCHFCGRRVRNDETNVRRDIGSLSS